MDWRAECVVVIPCLNEAGTIGALVCEVQRFLPRVIVVDDGSRDGTGKIAAEAGAVVVRHAEARGKGAALQSGWARARESGFAWALAMDGDAQHSPGDISTFLKRAAAGDVALVVGNRMANPAGMPWLRRVVNGWMSRRLSKAAGCALPDTQCGFRLMDLEAWSKLKLRSSHFEIESEMLLAFVEAGYAVAFVPIEVIYKNEQSKINPVQDTWRWFRWLWSKKGD